MQCIRNVEKDYSCFFCLFLFFYYILSLLKPATDILCQYLITCAFNMKRCFSLLCYCEVAISFACVSTALLITTSEQKGIKTEVEGNMWHFCAVTWSNKVLLEYDQSSQCRWSNSRIKRMYLNQHRGMQIINLQYFENFRVNG